MTIEVVLADDHAIVRQGLAAVISQEQDMKVVAEASNWQTSRHNPSIAGQTKQAKFYST